MNSMCFSPTKNQYSEGTRNILKRFGIPEELLPKIILLPPGSHDRQYVDYDGTMFNSKRRYAIMDGLEVLHGVEAYGLIRERFGTPEDESGFSGFIKELKPRQHMNQGHESFFDPENPEHIILTAGAHAYQEGKIKHSWPNLDSNRYIIVPKAEDKIGAILQDILKSGKLPRKVSFIDDRIDCENFIGVDHALEEILGIPVHFYKAIESHKEGSSFVIIQNTKKNIAIF